MTLRFEVVVGVPAATAGIWMVVGLYWLIGFGLGRRLGPGGRQRRWARTERP